MTRTNVWALHLAHFLDHYVILVFPSAVVYVAGVDTGIYAALIALVIFTQITFGFGSLPIAWAKELLGHKLVMAAYFPGLAVFLAALGLVLSQSFEPTPLLIFLLLGLGLAAAVYHPVGLSILSRSDDVEHDMSINGVFGNLGAAAAPYSTVLIIDYFGMAAAFIVPAVVAMALFFPFWFSTEADHPKLRRSSETTQGDDVNWPVVTILLTSVAAGGLIYTITTTALPQLMLVRVGDIDVQMAALVSSLALLFGAVAQYFIGRLIRAIGLIACIVIFGPAQFVLLTALTVTSGYFFFAAAVLLMVIMYSQVVINDLIVARNSAPDSRTRIYAFRSFIAFSSGTIAIPILSYFSRVDPQFTKVLLVPALAGIVILIGSLLYPRYVNPQRWTAVATPAEAGTKP
ncbi:MAG: MFS transporter [Rhodobacteraceae bacterium]|nr:MFS transporter [Paracoccaceae bacterium]